MRFSEQRERLLAASGQQHAIFPGSARPSLLISSVPILSISSVPVFVVVYLYYL